MLTFVFAILSNVFKLLSSDYIAEQKLTFSAELSYRRHTEGGAQKEKVPFCKNIVGYVLCSINRPAWWLLGSLYTLYLVDM